MRISVVVHIIMVLIIAFFYINSTPELIDDNVTVEIFRELPRVPIPKKTPPPVVKKEVPKPPKPEMPLLEEDIPLRKEITLQKEINVIQHEASLKIEKIPNQRVVDIQPSFSENINVETPKLETSEIETDARLKPTSDSLLSLPSVTDTGLGNAGVRKRSVTGVKTPSKSTGENIAESINKTGSGKEYGQGTGNNKEGNSTFSGIMGNLTDNIIASSGGW